MHILDPEFQNFKNWLTKLNAVEYLNAFISAGYDINFIGSNGLNDADLDCVGIPRSKLGLRKKLIALHELSDFTSIKNDDEDEENEDEEEEEEDDDGDESP
jgi:hypothetical protein